MATSKMPFVFTQRALPLKHFNLQEMQMQLSSLPCKTTEPLSLTVPLSEF